MVATELETRLTNAHGEEQRLLATRESLLSRLRHKDEGSWHEFFETYWKLIYNAARRTGLNDDEAQEVVQETMIGVSNKIPEFRYMPEICSFKTWLMRLTRWRIADRLRRRESHESLETACDIPEDVFSEIWEEDWERNLINAALERVKIRVDPWYFQVFSFCILQKKGVAETARVLNVMRARVYLANHRISKELTKEIAEMRETTGEHRK